MTRRRGPGGRAQRPGARRDRLSLARFAAKQAAIEANNHDKQKPRNLPLRLNQSRWRGL